LLAPARGTMSRKQSPHQCLLESVLYCFCRTVGCTMSLFCPNLVIFWGCGTRISSVIFHYSRRYSSHPSNSYIMAIRRNSRREPSLSLLLENSYRYLLICLSSILQIAYFHQVPPRISYFASTSSKVEITSGSFINVNVFAKIWVLDYFSMVQELISHTHSHSLSDSIILLIRFPRTISSQLKHFSFISITNHQWFIEAEVAYENAQRST
jgi:hypothetical protein